MSKNRPKKGGAKVVETLEKKGEVDGIINTALKYCNRFGIFTNFIIISVCIVVIGVSWKSARNYVKTDAKILSVNNKSENETCKTREELKQRTGKKEKSYCVIHLEYTVDGNKIRTSIEKDVSKGQFIPGNRVSIYYNKNNKKKVVFTTIGSFFLYLSLIVLVLTLLSTIIRMFYADNTLAKWWIGLTCFNTISDMTD